MKTQSKLIVLAVASVVLLTACGQSDIQDIERRELEDAQRVADLAAANSTPKPVSAAASGIDRGQLELVFSDEFNGDTIDASKWTTVQQWGTDLVINDELQYYVDVQASPNFGYNPFSFDSESLIISAVPTPDNLQSVANGQPYLSGVLSTAEKFDITHGLIEARVDFPEGAGLWPAFWMLGSQFEDLKPQLFIAEGNGAQPSSLFHNYNYHDSDGNLRSPGQWQVTQDDLAEGFHTVAVNWSPGELLFYIDGTPRYRIIGDNVSSQAMYMIINLAVGGVWTGSPNDGTVFPAELKVDYIRAYRHVGS